MSDAALPGLLQQDGGRGRGAAGPNLGFAVWPLGIKSFINPFFAALVSMCSRRALLPWDIQTSRGIKAGHVKCLRFMGIASNGDMRSAAAKPARNSDNTTKKTKGILQ